MNDPASRADIDRFVKIYKGQIDLGDILEPLASFQTFNQFFYRKLKAEARPVAFPDDPRVLVSAADCRLMAFERISEATAFWIKVGALGRAREANAGACRAPRGRP